MMKYLSIWIMKLLTFDECHNAEPNMPKNYWYIKKRAQQKRVRKRKTYTNRPFHFYVSKQFIKSERSTIVSITRFHSLDMVTVYIADWSICSDLSLHWLRFVIAVHWSCLLVNVACNDLELSDSSVTIIFHNTVLWAELGISLNFPHINFLPSNFDRLRFHFENKKNDFLFYGTHNKALQKCWKFYSRASEFFDVFFFNMKKKSTICNRISLNCVKKCMKQVQCWM